MKKIKNILSKSTSAVCGISEREVIVPKIEVDETITTLKKAGFHFIGRGPAGPSAKKIWFIRGGSL